METLDRNPTAREGAGLTLAAAGARLLRDYGASLVGARDYPVGGGVRRQRPNVPAGAAEPVGLAARSDALFPALALGWGADDVALAVHGRHRLFAVDTRGYLGGAVRPPRG